MITDRSAERRLSCSISVAIFLILALPIIRAQDPERMALNKPEKIIGNWQSVREGETVTATFSDKGQYEFGGIEDGKKVVLIKGTYTVDASAWPLKLTFLSDGKKSYGAIAVLSNDRIKLEKLGSPDEAPALDDNALTLARQPATLAENALNQPEKLVGKWKSIGDPLALEGDSLTMSFSDKGAFEMVEMEKNGEKHTQQGAYTVDATSSPMKVTVVAGERKGYYAVAILPNDQIKMEGLKSADQTAKMEEDAVTLVRDAKKPEIVAKLEAINKPENLVGSWKSIGARGKLVGATMNLRFSEKGEFEMRTEQDGRKTTEKGTYTVSGPRWPLEVTAVSGEKKHYLAITIMPGHQIVMDELKSFDEADAAEAFKNSVTLARQDSATPGIQSSEISKPLDLQNRENLIGTWKHTNLKISMSFSKGGDYQLRNEKNGKVSVVKGSYTVTSSGDSLVVHVTFDGGEDYYSVKLLSKDRFAWQQLKSPESQPDPDKEVVWLREQ